STRGLVICSALFLAALFVPSAFHWVVNVSSSSARAAIGTSLAFSLWFVLLSVVLLKGRLWRTVVFANLGALALIISLVPVTVTDAKNWAQGFEATKSLVEFLASSSTPPQAAAILIDVETHSLLQRKRSGEIVTSFQ